MKIAFLIVTLCLCLTGCSGTPLYVTTTTTEVVSGVVTVTVTMAEAVKPRCFESLEELQAWLDKQPLEYPVGWNCVDSAFYLQDRALADGFKMNYLSSENYYYNWFFTKTQLADGVHSYCSVRIGDWIYYVEPINHEISRRAECVGDEDGG